MFVGLLPSPIAGIASTRPATVIRAIGLFISGALDARTPIANAEELRKDLTTSYHIIIQNAGHDEGMFSLAPGLDQRRTPPANVSSPAASR